MNNKITEYLKKPKVRHAFAISGMTAGCFLVMLFVISIMPPMLSTTAVELPDYVPTTVEESTQTETEPETEAVPEETEAETIAIDKSKLKVDKTVTAQVATGNAKVDEDSGEKKVQDSSTSENDAPVVVITPPTVVEELPEVKSELTDYTFASSAGLTGLQKIGNSLFYFGDDGQLLKGHQNIKGQRYFFNKYGAAASKFGIDVSYYQKTIDWAKVKAAGVDYAIIRIGYRGYGEAGNMKIDINFEQNLTGAKAAGIDVGLYFFSQATTVEEANEEASLVINTLKGRSLQYPIYFDTEYSTAPNRTGRADHITKAQRTTCAIAFCETIKSEGYKSGVYASKSFFDDELNYSALTSYEIWVAHYTSSVTDFKHPYRMWQYSSKGEIDGISTAVDINISLYDYKKGSNMSDAGSDVVFLNSEAEVSLYEDAEKSVELCASEFSDKNYNAAESKVNALSNEDVKTALLKKLTEIKNKNATEKDIDNS